MKIAFVTIYDPKDIRRGSGTFYHMSQEIRRQGHEIHYIGPVDVKLPIVTRMVRSVGHRLRRRYKTYLDPFIGIQRGAKVTQTLISRDFDILITNDYGIAGNVKVTKPIVLYTDVMLPLNYPEGIHLNSREANLFSLGVKLFQYTIRKGLSRSTLCVFPAEWAAKQASEYAKRYRINPSKITIIPFGANIDPPEYAISQHRTLPTLASNETLHLLFVGKEWKRKGGEIAVKTTNILRERGINAQLHIVGCAPSHIKNNDYITIHGYLDKAVAGQREQLSHLYEKSHVFILPSVSEGMVISVLEAAAYGLPVLAYEARGVTEAVKSGKSGVLLKLGSSEEEFANIVEDWLQSPSEYTKLVSKARSYFENEVNWTKSIANLFDKIDHILQLS